MDRKTPQREAIQRVVEAAGRPINADEVLAAARLLVTGLGIATVYRTLKALTEGGQLQTVELAGEPMRYEAAGKAHHAHFRCRACTRVFEVEECPVRDTLLPRGFVAEDHEVVIHGTCVDCRPRPRRASRPG